MAGLQMRTILRLTPVVLVLGLAGAFAVHRFAPRHVPEGQAPLVELSPASLGELRGAFNQARGRVRLLVLVSPT